jgi:hypothetical protein
MLGIVKSRTFLTNKITVRFFSLKRFYLNSTPYQSCSPRRIDKFGLLNSLISISEAQDILIWISSVKVGIPAARRIPTRFLHWKLYFRHKLWWFFLRSYSQSYRNSRHCQFLNQIRRPFLINQITARFCSLKQFYLLSTPSSKL